MTNLIRHCESEAVERGGRKRLRAVLGILAASCALVLVVSCEDGSGGNIGSPTPVPSARLLQQGNFALAAPTEDSFHFGLTTITHSGAGRWEASVDWASEANTLWMWVAEGACSVEQFARPDCPFEATCPCRFVIRSETAVPKPRLLTIPGAAGGMRTLIVANLGPQQETAQYRVTLASSDVAAGDDAPAIDAPGSPSRVSIGRRTALR